MPRSVPSSSPSVGHVLAALDALAPLRHAADWDNVGLLAGSMGAPVRRILLSVDLTDDVAREALRTRTDLVVVYHPPIFKGIRRITADAEAPTRLLPELLAGGVAIIALHTALDAAPGGTNDVLLDAFDLAERFPLEPLVTRDAEYKLVVFTPPPQVDVLRAALSRAGAGVIGHYDQCSYELLGRGSFRGDETTNPAVGSRGQLEFVEEARLEMVVPRARLGEVVRALYATHPYEEPAFDLHPLHTVAARGRAGLGRVGVLRRAQRGAALVELLARRVDVSGATVVGDLRRRFSSVTAAAGAFGTHAFRDPASLVLTGEFKHHDALELLRRGITAVHLGHWASERPVLAMLAHKLEEQLRAVRVAVSRADRAPYQPLGRAAQGATPSKPRGGSSAEQ